MDESGDPGVGVGSPTPTYTVSAVFVHDTQWVSLFEDLLRFRRYLRDNFGLRMRAEMKASELVRGSGPWADLGLGDRVRKRIYRSFMRFQGKTGAVLTFAVVIDKNHCRDTDHARDIAWRYAFQRVERTMNARNERVMLVPDSGQFHWIRRLSREMRRFSQVGSMLGTGSLARPLIQVLIDDPVERDSRESYLIQLADLNAYAAYRRVVPTPAFPQTMWAELGPAILWQANKYSGGTPGIVRGP
ncbi:MAG: DUF3800 domain-containing protein [Actinomycetota bacterium]|nr:DUF3800 domain-containing protein [Actinomycetota bacterium]